MSLDLKKLLFDSVPASPAYTRSDSRGWIGHIATPTSQLDEQYREHQQQHVQRCNQLVHAAWGSPAKHKFPIRRVAVPLRMPSHHTHTPAAPVTTSTATARVVSRNSYCSSPRSTSRRLDIDPGRESVNNWMYDSDMEHDHDHDGEESPSTTLRSFRHGRHMSMSTNPLWDDEVGRVNTNVPVTNNATAATAQKQSNKSTASNTQTTIAASQPTQHHRQPSKSQPTGAAPSAPQFDLAILNASTPDGDSDCDSESDSDGDPDSDVEPEPESEPFGGFSSGSSSGANSHVPSAVSTVYTATRNMPASYTQSNPAPTTHDVVVTDTRVTIRAQPNLMVSIPSTSSLLSYGSSAPISAATPTSAQPTSFPLTSPPRLAPLQMPTASSATSSSSLLEQPTHTFRSYSSAPSASSTGHSNGNSPPEARLAPVTQVRLAPVPQPPIAARAPVTTNHTRQANKRSSMVVPPTINLMKTGTSSANSTSTSSSTSTSNSNSTSSTASTSQSSSSSSVIITARRHSMSYMPSSAVNVKQLSIWEDNNMNLTQSMTSKRYHNNNNQNTIMINTNNITNTQTSAQPIPILIQPATRTNHSRNPPHKSTNTIIVVDTHRRGSTTKFPSPIKSRHEIIS